jgi:hypothetical protein
MRETCICEWKGGGGGAKVEVERMKRDLQTGSKVERDCEGYTPRQMT